MYVHASGIVYPVGAGSGVCNVQECKNNACTWSQNTNPCTGTVIELPAERYAGDQLHSCSNTEVHAVISIVIKDRREHQWEICK